MANIKPYRIKTISEFHELRGLPKPEHPLISVINLNAITQPPPKGQSSFVLDFYSISLKRGAVNVKYRYGQQGYVFFISKAGLRN